MATDVNLALWKTEYYRGIVRVPLHTLSFQNPLVQQQHRDISQSNVTRLKNIFRSVGCLRLQQENVIDGVVDDEILDVALAACGITRSELKQLRWPKDAPSIEPKVVNCLSGLHRITAANQVLAENEKWWIVRLYAPGRLCCP